MSIRRRHWLLGAAAALGGAAVGGLGRPRSAAAQWGQWPQHLEGLRLPAERRASRVLELFFYGGLCPWDTFYCVPGWGASAGQYLHAFDVMSRFSLCGGSGAVSRLFGEDARGQSVHLGPWAHPLWSRPDLLARMRVVVTRHDQLPHETAIPLALTGSRLGSPQLAGTGSAMQRHFGEAEPRAAPYAYVLHPGGEFVGENLGAGTATGLHPVAARPWDLAIDQGTALAQQLQRPATEGHRDEHDALVAAMSARYEARLVGAGSGQRMPSPGFDAWQAAAHAQRQAPQLASLLGPSLFGLPLAEQCDVSMPSVPATSARAAARLLSGPDAARYALWIDGGLSPSQDGGHDTHKNHLDQASLNYVHALRTLAQQINAPGEDDPQKLDLDDTLIVITTEFGRAPGRQDERGGLNHWPHGYVSVLLGGPVDVDGAGVFGAIDEGSGTATQFVTPADLRAAILDATGVYPFDAGGFGLGDLSGEADTDAAALARLRADVLGVT